MNKKVNLESAKFEYIEIFLIIMVSVSPLLNNELRTIIILIIVLFNLKYVKSNIKVNYYLLLYFMIIFSFHLVLDNRYNYLDKNFEFLNLYYPTTILLGFIMNNKYSSTKYLNIIEKIIFIISVLSLFSVITYTYLPNLVFRLPIYKYYGTTHRTAYIFNILTPSRIILQRNSGIASEPGLFQLLVNLSLYNHLNDKSKDIKIFNIIVYTIVILTTKSTTGLIIYLFIILKFFVEKNRFVYIFLLLPFIFPMFYNEIKSIIDFQINNKLFGTISFNIRFEPFINSMIFGFQTLLGKGNKWFSLFAKSNNLISFESFGQIIVRYGLNMFLLILYRILKIIKKDLFLFVIIFFTLISQSIWYVPLITYFYFDNNRKEETNYEYIMDS